MWEPRPLTILWALTACYRDNFTLVSSPQIPCDLDLNLGHQRGKKADDGGRVKMSLERLVLKDVTILRIAAGAEVVSDPQSHVGQL
jgi:hypothetical protein